MYTVQDRRRAIRVARRWNAESDWRAETILDGNAWSGTQCRHNKQKKAIPDRDGRLINQNGQHGREIERTSWNEKMDSNGDTERRHGIQERR